MFTFQGFPITIVVALVVLAWLSFFSVMIAA